MIDLQAGTVTLNTGVYVVTFGILVTYFAVNTGIRWAVRLWREHSRG